MWYLWTNAIVHGHLPVYTQWYMILVASTVTVWDRIIHLLSVVFYEVHTAGKVRDKKSAVFHTVCDVCVMCVWSLSALQPFSSCHGLNASSIGWYVYFIKRNI